MERASGHEYTPPWPIKHGDVGDAVRGLLSELRACLDNMAVNPKLKGRFEEVSDSIETLARESICPKIKVNWESYGLSPAQERFCNILLARLGQGLSRDAIVGQMYFDRPPGSGTPQTKILDVMVCMIRKKLAATDCPYRIESVRGRGYRLDLSPDEPAPVLGRTG